MKPHVRYSRKFVSIAEYCLTLGEESGVNTFLWIMPFLYLTQLHRSSGFLTASGLLLTFSLVMFFASSLAVGREDLMNRDDHRGLQSTVLFSLV